MLRLTSLLLCALAILDAQNPLVPGTYDRENRYELIRNDTTATAEALTVQQPASTPGLNVQFELYYLSCSMACNVTISQNGTAATTTALTPTPLNGAPPATVSGFRSSNVGSGTTLNTYYVAAGGTLALDLTKFYLNRNQGTAANLTFTVASASGTIQSMVQWIERQ